MVNQNVEQNGLLSEHPLAELIREAGAAGLSGAFRISRDRVKSVIYFDSGRLLFAISNVRKNRLLESARKWNFVNDYQLNAFDATASDVQLGAALIESGALTEEKLAELFSLQVASVLRPMLIWIDGSWSFDPRVRLVENVNVVIHLPQLLMESGRRLPPDFVQKRFQSTNELISVSMTPSLEFALQPVEAFLLSRIDTPGMRLHDLLSVSGLPDQQTLSALYPLALGGFVERDSWHRAFLDETLGRFKAIAEVVMKREKESGKSERPVLVKSAAESPAAAKQPEPKVDEQQEIDQFLSRVELAEDFYEVLAVIQSADAKTIKRTYHSLARRFHPDRFHKETGTHLHTRLQAAFARVAQAYEMLRDSTLRAAYDLRLQNEKRMRKPASYSTVVGAQHETKSHFAQTNRPGSVRSERPSQTDEMRPVEETFKQGMLAFEEGNLQLAAALFAEASRRKPKEARYRAYYGRSLSRNKQMRHQAEAELRAAVSLDTNNASFRLMLAELYREHGMTRRAQGEAQRALTIDPNNKEAQRFLKELNEQG